MSELRIGIDIGKRHDPSAVVIAFTESRSDSGKPTTHYTIPFLKRLKLETSYPEQVKELVAICDGAVKRFSASKGSGFHKKPQILVDVTGVGDAVVDLLAPQVERTGILRPCRFAGGDQLIRNASNSREIRVGKSYFVSRLQILSESKRIHLPAQLAEAQQLSQEMLDFDIDVDEASGKATYGAIRPGTHDDLVTAIGLACLQEEEPNPGPLICRGAKRSGPRLPGETNWFSEAAKHHL